MRESEKFSNEIRKLEESLQSFSAKKAELIDSGNVQELTLINNQINSTGEVLEAMIGKKKIAEQMESVEREELRLTALVEEEKEHFSKVEKILLKAADTATGLRLLIDKYLEEQSKLSALEKADMRIFRASGHSRCFCYDDGEDLARLIRRIEKTQNLMKSFIPPTKEDIRRAV